MKTNPHAPANPTIWDDHHQPSFQRDNDGMSILETMSMAAMQGMLLSGAMTEHGVVSRSPETIARQAVMQAKALIAELNKEEQ